jgi:hypothetical protein
MHFNLSHYVKKSTNTILRLEFKKGTGTLLVGFLMFTTSRRANNIKL